MPTHTGVYLPHGRRWSEPGDLGTTQCCLHPRFPGFSRGSRCGGLLGALRILLGILASMQPCHASEAWQGIEYKHLIRKRILAMHCTAERSPFFSSGIHAIPGKSQLDTFVS